MEKQKKYLIKKQRKK